MILNLLSSKNFITFNKIVAKKLGLESALTLGEICSLSNIFKDREFYFTYSQIADETCLSEYAVKKAVQKLVTLGILSIKRKGIPCKSWYTISENKIIEILESDFHSSSPYESEGTRDYESEESSTDEIGGSFKYKDIREKYKEKDIISCSTNNDNDNFLESNPKSKKETPPKKFVKPCVEEIADYCKERGNSIDAQYFFDYYESKGWLIGKNHMKDWKACVRTWERKEVARKKTERKESAYGDFANVFEARAYSEEMIAKDNSLYDFFDKHYNDWLLAHCPTGSAFDIFRQKQTSIDEKNGRSYDYWSND